MLDATPNCCNTFVKVLIAIPIIGVIPEIFIRNKINHELTQTSFYKTKKDYTNLTKELKKAQNVLTNLQLTPVEEQKRNYKESLENAEHQVNDLSNCVNSKSNLLKNPSSVLLKPVRDYYNQKKTINTISISRNLITGVVLVALVAGSVIPPLFLGTALLIASIFLLLGLIYSCKTIIEKNKKF